MSSSKKPQAARKPRPVRERADAARQKTAAAKVAAIGEKMERHDPAKLRKRARALRDGEVPELGPSEKWNPGRLTKDGRKGARVVRAMTLHFERERGAAIAEAARVRSLEQGRRVTEAQVIAAALARAGIGGALTEEELA